MVTGRQGAMMPQNQDLIVVSSGGSTAEAANFAEAHERVMAMRDLQFQMAVVERPRPPGWLEPLHRMLSDIGPLIQWVFWIALAALALTIAWLIARELARVRRQPRAEGRTLVDDDWRPAEHAARALLSDADNLAAQGRFAEAAHLILLRSIDDIKTRRPDVIRPAWTTRDIRDLAALPVSARPAFARIAEVVETSLFGGRPVDSAAFQACRGDYEAFALPRSWSR